MADDNEWGIPDWRNADAYGDWRSWSDARWRWEFCRREDELRDEFDKEAKRLVAAPSEEIEFLSFVRSLPFVNPSKSVQQKFGYRVLPNPRLSADPLQIWLIDPEHSYLPVWAARPLRETFVEQGLAFTSDAGVALGHLLNATPVSIDCDQFAVVFDLNYPLIPQIEATKARLESLYRSTSKVARPRDSLSGTAENPRDPLEDQFLALLRTLDADAANVGYREITKLHPRCDATPATRRDKLKQARKIWRRPNIL
jgi:hypothetical protein